MLVRLPMLLLKLLGVTFFIWITLTTIIPQTLLKYTNCQIQQNKFEKSNYPYNSITSPTPLPLLNSSVYFIIGHPDDEVMFFSPSLIEITKKKHNNDVKLICFSKGDAVDESFGKIRAEELKQSARIIGIESGNVIILDNFKDGMNEHWSIEDINKSLINKIGTSPPNKKDVIFITFDDQGVSNHPNHISLYYGTKHFFTKYYQKKYPSKLYGLKSLNFLEKYSFTLLTNVELFIDQLFKFIINNVLKLNINIDISFFSNNNHSSSSSIKVYSDLNMLSVSYAAMAYGHFSQMVWFRYGWLIFSRYLTFNHLIEYN